MENDALLVKSLSKGNILAFNTLFKKYSGHLYRFSYRYLQSKTESEELVQEVFTIIWEKRSELKNELSFKSYIFTIAFNIIRKYFRTRKYISKYFNTEIYNDVDIQTSQKINYDSLHDYIIELVNQLPAKRREIFIKSRFEGLNIKEISEELGISHKTVENQLTNALKFIRTNFNRDNILTILVFIQFIL
ncbi:MAG TPA: RNA polymerase sigma-70 factor [Bacteroidales bacterium]|jgi:RNA polymerase sigma-70 factor (ECF subfamily)|nr:RNA polymerase sigma-70 factor [Bacteroidales bacterium]